MPPSEHSDTATTLPVPRRAMRLPPSACFTVASTAAAFLKGLFGGIAPRRHPWQPHTVIFIRGWAGMPAVVDRVLNGWRILACGPPTERLLGLGPFLLLSTTTAVAHVVVLSLTAGVNGASLVIWSWGPSLVVALWWAAQAHPRFGVMSRGHACATW